MNYEREEGATKAKNEFLAKCTQRQRQLGLGESKGISTYFSSNCEPDDADICGRFLESMKLAFEDEVRVRARAYCARELCAI